MFSVYVEVTFGKWELKWIILKNYKTLKKKDIFRIQIRISIEKCSFPIGKLHFSIESI